MFKKTLIAFLLIFSIPINVFAYSEKIIASGENIGITLNTDGILIAGTYSIGNISPATDAGLKSGDIIKKVDGQTVSTIDELALVIENVDSQEIKIEYSRELKKHNTTLKLVEDDEILKTGLYVKDSVTGIGTLTFIDPETKVFGALGHEITNISTGKILEIKNGKILESTVTDLIPSADGYAGEKKAQTIKKIEGNINENTKQGVFGTYTGDVKGDTYQVASTDEIKLGSAQMLTVLNGTKIEKYDINITKINEENNKTKNFIFEITDKELLNKTGGIIQGMSGSPIVQGEYIVGAVTHVMVDSPEKGYGIFITNMLEEAEK